jgi:hypothetical protein
MTFRILLKISDFFCDSSVETLIFRFLAERKDLRHWHRVTGIRFQFCALKPINGRQAPPSFRGLRHHLDCCEHFAERAFS